MENTEKLTCGFHLVRDGEFKRCGRDADHQVLKKPVCAECAKYMRMRGLPVYKMRKSTIERKLKELNSEPKEKMEVATA